MRYSNNFNDFYVMLILSVVIAFILLFMTPIANASQNDVDSFVNSYQMYNPSAVDVKMGRQGRGCIYGGLTDK